MPGIAFRVIGPPESFHDQSYCVRRPLGGMRRLGGQQKHVSLADGFFSSLTIRSDVLEDDVALQLIEELITGIDVEVPARIRPSDDHHDDPGVFPDHLCPHWGFQQTLMLIDPSFEVERFECRFHAVSLYLQYSSWNVRRPMSNSRLQQQALLMNLKLWINCSFICP